MSTSATATETAEGIPLTGREEWRRYPLLPIAAGLGYATSVIHIYGFGPYIGPIAEDLGWSRTLVTAGLTMATLVQAVGGIVIGVLVDKYGPRRFGVIGLLMIGAAFALLGTATGSAVNWYFLWALIALAALPVQASVWTSAVASRFNASRGMAFAVTLCGASVAAAVFPLLATRLIGEFGWRTATAGHAGIWLLFAFPMIFLFFRGAYDRQGRKAANAPAAPRDLPGMAIREALFSANYARLAIASLLFTFTILAIVVHFVPILTDRGADPMAAAGIASLVGIFSIFGRLGTGFALDRFSAPKVGALVFLLPALGSLLMLFGGSTWLVLAAAAALVGLTLGAEIDVIVYLTSRFFGLKNFGALYGGLLAALSVGTALGPLAAAAVYDTYGDYTLFLWLTIAFMIGSSLALITLPRDAPDWDGAAKQA